MSEFIGRGENRAIGILEKIFPDYTVGGQVPIKELIKPEQFSQLGSVYQKHKHDIVLLKDDDGIVIEVNYKHGPIAYEKWDVFQDYLRDNGFLTMTIEENETTALLRKKDSERTDTWDDWIDVINSLKIAGVKPQ